MTMGEYRNENWLGLWTLYWREVRRFIKVYNQTIVAPVVTSLLFLAVFALALGQTGAWPQCGLSRFPRAGTGDDGDLAERIRQYVLVDDHRQGAGQHRRYADAAADGARTDLGDSIRRRHPRPCRGHRGGHRP